MEFPVDSPNSTNPVNISMAKIADWRHWFRLRTEKTTVDGETYMFTTYHILLRGMIIVHPYI